MDDDTYKSIELHESEVKVEFTKDSGAGGQHRNKTQSCVVLTHYGTGIKVKCDGRDQHKNKRKAWKELTERVNHLYKTGFDEENVEKRREQVGNGSRGDKRRTYRAQSDQVTDHVTGKTVKLKDILKGKIELLK